LNEIVKPRITATHDRDVLRKMQDDAAQVFQNHVIRSHSDGRWVLQSKHADGGWENAFWVEVVALRRGSVLVHGDIDHIIFGQYRDSEDPEACVRWMGRRNSVDDYVLEKARIGMGSPHDVISHSAEVWLHHAKRWAQEEYVDHAGGVPEWLSEAISELEEPCGMNFRDVLETVSEDSDAVEMEAHTWGEIPSSRLVYCHEALRRLVALLDQERDQIPMTTDSRSSSDGIN